MNFNKILFIELKYGNYLGYVFTEDSHYWRYWRDLEGKNHAVNQFGKFWDLEYWKL